MIAMWMPDRLRDSTLYFPVEVDIPSVPLPFCQGSYKAARTSTWDTLNCYY